MKYWVIAGAVALAIASSTAWAKGGHRGGHSRHFGHKHFAPHFVHKHRHFAPHFGDHHHGFRSHLGLFFAFPLVVSPAFAYPPPVVYGPEPTYIEQAPAPEESYRYFCPDSRAYYPEVPECPSGWLRVLPGGAGPTDLY